MTINAVNNNVSNNSRQNVFAPTSIGALSGYALMWAIPITKQEKDEFYKQEIKNSNALVKAAKNAKLNELVNNTNKQAYVDEFVSLIKNKSSIHQSIKNSNDDVKIGLRILLAQINKQGSQTRRIELKKIKTFIKSIRPAEVFVGMGAAAGFVWGLLNSKSATNNNEQK